MTICRITHSPAPTQGSLQTPLPLLSMLCCGYYWMLGDQVQYLEATYCSSKLPSWEWRRCRCVLVTQSSFPLDSLTEKLWEYSPISAYQRTLFSMILHSPHTHPHSRIYHTDRLLSSTLLSHHPSPPEAAPLILFQNIFQRAKFCLFDHSTK